MKHEFSIALRFMGEGLDLDEITRATGLTPSHLRRDSDGINLWGYNGTDIYDEPLWWDSFDEGFNFLLDKLQPALPAIERFREMYDTFFWCGHFSSAFDGGPLLSAKLLERLGKLKIKVYLDTHCLGSSDD